MARKTGEVALGVALTGVVLVRTGSITTTVVCLLLPRFIITVAGRWAHVVETGAARARLVVYGGAGLVASTAACLAGLVHSDPGIVVAVVVARTCHGVSGFARPYLVGSALTRRQLVVASVVSGGVASLTGGGARAFLVADGSVVAVALGSGILTIAAAAAFRSSRPRPPRPVVRHQHEIAISGVDRVGLAGAATAFTLAGVVLPAAAAQRLDLSIGEIVGWSWVGGGVLGVAILLAVPLVLRARGTVAMAWAGASMVTGTLLLVRADSPLSWLVGAVIWASPAFALVGRAAIELLLHWERQPTPRPAPVTWLARAALPAAVLATGVALTAAALVDAGLDARTLWPVATSAAALAAVATVGHWSTMPVRASIAAAVFRSLIKAFRRSADADVYEVAVEVAGSLRMALSESADTPSPRRGPSDPTAR